MTRNEIQLVRSLGDKRPRAEEGLFVAEGEKLVRELIGSGLRVMRIYQTEEIFAFPKAEDVSGKEMARISRLKTPTPVLALVEIPRHGFDPGELKGKLALALDEVRNPGNLGTIIRLADWFGVSDIVCSHGTADCYNPKVVQATMGAITRVRVHYGDLPQMITAVGGPVYGTFLEGGNIYDQNLSAHGIVVLGNEGIGISDAVTGLVTDKLFIPPFPADRKGSESLNVAAAAAIALSEFRRR